ncbi:MAG TPA: hypothetical protein VI670_23890 [Thermoanaerobaculia bacterium]
MPVLIDRRALLERLEVLEPLKKEENFEEMMRQVSMAAALPALTEINHEREYLLCRQLAEHLVGKVHQPDVIDAE